MYNSIFYALKAFKCLSIGANYSFLNTKGTVGGVIEITPKAGPNIYIGCDYLPLAVAEAPMFGEAPSFLKMMGFESMIIPMSLRLNLHFGMSFALGGAKKSRY